MRTIIIYWVRRIAVLLAATVVLAGCGAGDPTSERPSIVVTTSILGAVVRDVVGDAADVVVLIPNGTDPHDWEPSARAIETLNKADLVVANGLGLEEKMAEALAQAQADGVRVFSATEHIEPQVSAGDPHFWTDPLAMVPVVDALGQTLADIGVDVGSRVERVITDLVDVDGVISTLLSSIPASSRVLVTGHESLDYFAHRYDFTLIGSIVPGLTSAADVTAANLADLKSAIAETGTRVIFTELGTPTDVAEALAKETGTRVVELATHLVPADGLYRSFLLNLASDITSALATSS